MRSVRRILRENTTGWRVTATKIIFVPQNKQQTHRSQTSGATELHSAWQERPMVLPHRSRSGFSKIFKISICFKMFQRTPCSNLPPSPYWLLTYTSSAIFFWRNILQWARASSFTKFLDHTQRRTTLVRTSLDEWSARRRDTLPENIQHSQQTNVYAPSEIRTHNPSRRAAADLRPRPRGHCDRLFGI